MKELELRSVKWPAQVAQLISDQAELHNSFLPLSPALFLFQDSICLGSLSWAIILVIIAPDSGIDLCVKDRLLSSLTILCIHSLRKNWEEAWAAQATYQTEERDGVPGDVVVGQNLRISADSKGHVLKFLHQTMEYGHSWCF